jgi:hypothetical protein
MGQGFAKTGERTWPKLLYWNTTMANKFKQPAQAQTKSSAKNAAPQKKVGQAKKGGKK